MLIASKTDLIPLDYRVAFPNTSFTENGPSDEFLENNGYSRVSFFKEHTQTQKLVATSPYLEGNFVYTVEVQEKTSDELLAEENTKLEALQRNIVARTQARLDAFALTRNYSSILSATTYADSAIAKFATEGAYAKQARDATWAKLYEILAEVQAGTRPAPTSYEEIEPELPVLQWPN